MRLILLLPILFCSYIHAQLYIGMTEYNLTNHSLNTFVKTSDTTWQTEDYQAVVVVKLYLGKVISEDYHFKTSEAKDELSTAMKKMFIPYKGNIVVSTVNNLYCYQNEHNYLFTFRRPKS